MPDLLDILQNWWPVPLAYLIGATPFGFLAGKIKGIDIRDHGSGNIGATNVMRTLGKPVGVTVLLLDVLKGVAPVMVALFSSEESIIPIAASLGAILGHNYTFWLGFKGGKGIATTAGAVLPLMPYAILFAVLAWLVTLKISRYVSVASITAATAIPTEVLVESLIKDRFDIPTFCFALFVCLLAIWKHRSNIGRLKQGEEPKTGFEKSTL
jgi:glycerol-3-phosphate acyltransferase PlsY